MPDTSLAAAALAYARQGIPVFPCRPGGKAPACAGGFTAASCDPEVVGRWWSENPAANIGVAVDRAGWYVVDLDGPAGVAAWNALCEERGDYHLMVLDGCCLGTRLVRTWSGGFHLYFIGSAASTVRALGPGIDTRGVGGYVLVPPSVIDGCPYTEVTP